MESVLQNKYCESDWIYFVFGVYAYETILTENLDESLGRIRDNCFFRKAFD